MMVELPASLTSMNASVLTGAASQSCLASVLRCYLFAWSGYDHDKTLSSTEHSSKG